MGGGPGPGDRLCRVLGGSASDGLLVPTGRAGEVWAIHDDIDATLLRPGEPPVHHEIDGARWADIGVGDGLMVRLLEEGGPGELVYWSPGDGIVRLDSIDDPQTWVLGSWGDLLAIREGGAIVVIDVERDVRVAEIPEVLIVDRACFSPDGTHLALWYTYAPESSVAIIDVAAQSVLFERDVGLADRWSSLGWVGGDLVFITGEGRSVQKTVGLDPASLDAATGGLVTEPVVEMSGAAGWWMTTDDTNC